MDIMNQKPTLQVINSAEVREIEEWERLYPDKWGFIEVTREDEWEVYEGKLIAIADDSIEFEEIGRSYHDRGIANLTTRGVYTEPQPAVTCCWLRQHSAWSVPRSPLSRIAARTADRIDSRRECLCQASPSV